MSKRIRKKKVKAHISYSELMDFDLCPHYHYLKHIEEREKFTGSEYTAVGTAIHEVCEIYAKRENMVRVFEGRDDFEFDLQEAIVLYNAVYKKEILRLLEDRLRKDPEYEPDQEAKHKILEIREQGEGILIHILPALKETFGTYTVVDTELKLYEKIEGQQKRFKGFIDLVIRDEQGIYHVIDWKSCSWGWDARKKSDKRTTYQLTYYKHFFAKMLGVSVDRVECHFALLKRTAKKNRVEIFRVPAGKRKINNALELLNNALNIIENGEHEKDFSSCRSDKRYGECPFIGTEHCPGSY